MGKKEYDLKIKTDNKSLTNTYGKFIVQPLERGYGVTVGNALRRVLLTSLPGAAITNVKIEGAHHEFSTIDGVKEVQFYSGPGDKVYPLRSGQDRLGYILCLSDSIEKCELALEQAKQELVLEINK